MLVALTRGSAFTVLAGDPRQLPPTVLSEEAAREGLGVTLFERVAGSGALGGGAGRWLNDSLCRQKDTVWDATPGLLRCRPDRS